MCGEKFVCLRQRIMKTYKVISESSMWSTEKLQQRTERLLNEATQAGYEVISVSFGHNIWGVLTAYVTLCKEEKTTTSG